MIRYRGKRKAHAAWGNIRKVALVGSPDAKAKANLLPSILSPKKPDDADASPKKPTTRDPIDVDPSDIDPVDRLFVRILLLSESYSAIDTILKHVDPGIYARIASQNGGKADLKILNTSPSATPQSNWRRVYAIFAPYDARDGDELVPKMPVKSVNRLERSVAQLWKTRSLRCIHIDDTSHIAYASLENKFHDPDIMVGCLMYHAWGKVLCIDHPTFRMAG